MMGVEAGIAVEAALGKFLTKVATSTLINVGSNIFGSLASVESNFGEHIRQSYERCSKIRTILNRNDSVELLSLYVNLSFSAGGPSSIEDYDLIDQIRSRKRSIIYGVGGGGKTMFMKYLWLSFFEKPDGRIPLFVELRRFNEISSGDFLSFLFRSSVGSASRLIQTDFEKGLEQGSYTIILDGFDEIVEERRQLIEAEILKLSSNYPDIIIVVSGRPDERFSAWQQFPIFKVSPLTKKQVISLIEKLDYDSKIKKKFIQRVKSDLYERHRSFMSSPLLATMMMLTFDQFADIPEKIHLFYEQAFDTLFAKHDATKEAYKRRIFTGLPIDTFKQTLSYFCLISYYEEKYEFSEFEVRSYLSKSISIMGVSIITEDMLRDLVESVCILQKDGLNYTFTHRSFQEYFSAFCLSFLVPSKVGEICKKIARRYSDNVIYILYDMNPELLESEYIIVMLNDVIRISKNSVEKHAFEYMKHVECILLTHRIEDVNRQGAGLDVLHTLLLRYFRFSMLSKKYTLASSVVARAQSPIWQMITRSYPVSSH